MSALTNALERILNWWKKNGYEEVVYNLQSGLNSAEIEEIVKHLPFELPLEVWDIYQWRNGSRDDEGWFLPLQKAVNLYLANLESYEALWQQEYVLRDSPKGFQIFPHNFESKLMGYLVIQENLETCPVIFEHIKTSGCIVKKYASLTSMMLTLAECLETKVYERDERGYQIWRKHNISIIEKALTKLENDISLESLNEIAADLIRFKDSRVVKPLIQALSAPKSEIVDSEEKMGIRQLAAQILGELGDLRAVEPLICALNDKYFMTRIAAAMSLGQLRDERAVQPLINVLQDSDEDVRRAAAGSLVKLKAVEPLIEVLNHNDKRVRFQAVWALGDIRDLKAVEPLSQLTEDEDKEVKEAALRALKQIHS
jgi:hypothetical protein